MASERQGSSTGKTLAWAWPLAVALALAGAWGALRRFGLRPDMRLLPSSLRLTVPSVLLVSFAVLLLLLLLVPPRRAILVGALSLIVGAVGATVGNPEGFHPSALGASYSCLVIGLGVALPSLAVAVLVMWRRDIREHAELLGASFGLTIGLVGVATLHLRCPLVGTSHGLLFHEGPALLLAVIGAFAGRRLARALAQRGGAPR